MSEETNTGNTINLNSVPECVNEPIKAILNPAANQIGNLLGDLLTMATSKIHFSAERMRIRQAHDLEEFKKSLTDKILEKPEECLVEPRLQVVGPAAENAKFCIGEPQIAEMFQCLLANAADSRYQSKVHPSFAGIISQLSPLDAENLVLISQKDSLPIVEYRYNYQDDSYRVVFQNYFLENAKMRTEDDLARQSESLSALQKQGLVMISYSRWLNNEKEYSKFKETETYRKMESEAAQARAIFDLANQNIQSVGKADFQKGMVELTPIGKAFAEVCFKT